MVLEDNSSSLCQLCTESCDRGIDSLFEVLHGLNVTHPVTVHHGKMGIHEILRVILVFITRMTDFGEALKYHKSKSGRIEAREIIL